MPTSPRSKPQPINATVAGRTSDRLRPYIFHKVDLEPQGSHAVGDCPFCGREAKFSVDIATGLWRCFVCASGTDAGGGNGLVFIRLVHERAAGAILDGSRDGSAAFLAAVAADRGLIEPATVAAWGVCRAADGAWLVPGYSVGDDGKPRLDQVYRRTRIRDGNEWVWRLLPTPGLWTEGRGHALHLPAGDYNPARPRLDVCEGSWDGMVYWEARKLAGLNHNTNVISVPGCGTWREEWTALCRGKQVTFLFDSDHPRCIPGTKVTSRAGYDGMRRAARKVSGVAASVSCIKWGPDGYDPSRPSGYDVRDWLTGA